MNTSNTTSKNAPNSAPDRAPEILHTQQWLERTVIGLNLCPFAKAVHVRDKIRYVVYDRVTDEGLLARVVDELKWLNETSADTIDTTLIIAPHVFAEFEDFNDFLGEAEDELWVQGFEGVFQLASFHPRYQFADTHASDAQNNTNRAPYPTLHILREASVDAAVASFPNPDAIYEQNIRTMEKLGNDGYVKLLAT
jgi:uncharacterized protein